MSRHVIFTVLVLIGICKGAIWAPEKDEDRCETAIKETIQDDRLTIVDETPNRLHSTWLSQECEVRAGPEYVIRKYTFFQNGTFLLLRHHYAEESCSVAMYTVAARGVIRILSASNVAPGATDARFQLDRVHIVPLTRQVAQKYSHRVNFSCMAQPRWRPYVPQLIYEQPSRRFSNFLWQGPKYNVLQPRHYAPSKKHRGLDCLDALGIEFGELRLVRVQKRASINAFDVGSEDTPRFELYLASLPPNVYSRKTHKPTSLQPTPLLRADNIKDCLVCGAISRGTESSPPLLHEVAALPALLGGSWLSSRCESCEGGLWIKRQLEVYSGDSLWTGRWDYYSDPRCTYFLYAVTAAGSYMQRAGRRRRHGEESPEPETFGESLEQKASKESREASASASSDRKSRRSVESEDSYRHLLQNAQPSMADAFAAMLRGNQRREETTKKPITSSIPTGTTELDLHVAESLLIAGDLAIAARCGAQIYGDDRALGRRGLRVRPLINWPRSCVKHALEAPSTLGLRARVGVNWSGQYTLLLGPRDDHLWEAPLHKCGPTPSHNPSLRAHLRRSVGLRYGLYTSGANSQTSNYYHLLIAQQLVTCLCYLLYR